MERQRLWGYAVALMLAPAIVCAQEGTLAGVTMRVLDDLDGVDAVVLELDGNRAQDEEGAADARNRDADEGAGERRDAATGDPFPERDRDDLEDVDREERSEGKLEDNDVERTPPPEPAAVP
jgi:hypothetical protein